MLVFIYFKGRNCKIQNTNQKAYLVIKYVQVTFLSFLTPFSFEQTDPLPQGIFPALDWWNIFHYKSCKLNEQAVLFTAQITRKETKEN